MRVSVKPTNKKNCARKELRSDKKISRSVTIRRNKMTCPREDSYAANSHETGSDLSSCSRIKGTLYGIKLKESTHLKCSHNTKELTP